MKLTAEQIYEALFQYICTLNNAQTTPLKTMSRRWIPWTELGDLPMPCFFQRQPPDAIQVTQQKNFGVSKYHLRAELWFYFANNVADMKTPVSPILNKYFAAIDNLMKPPTMSAGGARQQLGLQTGIENAWIDGTATMDEGLITPPAILLVPITVSTG